MVTLQDMDCSAAEYVGSSGTAETPVAGHQRKERDVVGENYCCRAEGMIQI